VLLVASADEEHGGRMGMGWLARNMPELLEAECAINEGGGGATAVGGHLFYTCQTAEKGLCRIVVTARSEGRHASQPRRDIATLKLARSLSRLGDGYLLPRAIPTMREALRTIASAQSSYAAQRVSAILEQGRVDEAMVAAGLDAEGVRRMRPLFYDTAAVTGLMAGDPESINVIPASALAYIDGRILPGSSISCSPTWETTSRWRCSATSSPRGWNPPLTSRSFASSRRWWRTGATEPR